MKIDVWQAAAAETPRSSMRKRAGQSLAAGRTPGRSMSGARPRHSGTEGRWGDSLTGSSCPPCCSRRSSWSGRYWAQA